MLSAFFVHCFAAHCASFRMAATLVRLFVKFAFRCILNNRRLKIVPIAIYTMLILLLAINCVSNIW